MAYEYYQIVCGRVASRSLCYYGHDNTTMMAAVQAAELADTEGNSSLERHDRHDGDYPSYSVGWGMGSIGPDSVHDASKVRLTPTDQDRAEAENMLAALPEPLRTLMAALPFGTWLVCTAA